MVSLPKLHPRHAAVGYAHNDLATAVIAVVKQYNLTYAELVHILSEEIMSWTKYEIRDERHPDDPDTPGRWE